MEKIKFSNSVSERVSKLLHDNHSLKLLMVGAYVVCIFSMTISLIQTLRRPIVLPLSYTGEKLKPLEGEPWSAHFVEEAIREYLDYRYSWSPADQAKHLSIAKLFISSGSISAFEKIAKELLQFSKDKRVSQRVYVTDMDVDMKQNVAHVIADRFNEIQGLKAASILNVKIYFERGKTSLENPWGLSVTKEEEIVPQ